VWEVREGRSLLAVWDGESETVVALDEDHALPILAADRDVNFQWRKHRGMSGKPGRLIVVDPERCRRLLAALSPRKAA
jgi:hypothetical protein